MIQTAVTRVRLPRLSGDCEVPRFSLLHASMRQMAKLHLTLLSLWVSARAALPHTCQHHYCQPVCGSAALVKTHSKIRVRCRQREKIQPPTWRAREPPAAPDPALVLGLSQTCASDCRPKCSSWISCPKRSSREDPEREGGQALLKLLAQTIPEITVSPRSPSHYIVW